MKSKIAAVLVAICSLGIIGIVGAVEMGDALRKMWWCIPLFIIIVVCGNIICKDADWRW